MPLIKSGSKKAVSSNIRQLKSEKYPQKQAIAIALDVARRARRKAGGGAVDELVPPPRTPTQMPEEWNEAVRSAAGRIANTLAAPGRAMQGGYSVKPTVPGLWSEEDEFRQQHAQRQQAEDAAALALDVAQARFPFAKSGESGVFGGKLKQPGIKAYHGSPHDFDRFDMSKIGTGEGAQAYGHGLYFAENPKVAADYRRKLSGAENIAADDVGFAKFQAEWEAAQKALTDFKAQNPHWVTNPEHRAKAMDLSNALMPIAEKMAEDTLLRKPWLKTGRMYEVNINAHPDQFIDWDAPLSKQPKLEQTMRRIGADPTGPGFEGPLTGAEGYRALQNKYFLDQIAGRGTNIHPDEVNAIGTQAVGKMAQEGIPGIKYLDQGSRRASELQKIIDQSISPDRVRLAKEELAKLQATHNYVVFDDKLIDILRKYGVASVAALPPAVQASLGLLEEGEVKKADGGAAMRRTMQYAKGGAPRVPGPSFFQRDANRALSRQSGLIKSVVPGRTDKHPMRVASGSYILPADHVSALGQNNTLSGAKFLRRKFGMGGGAYADGGEVSVPVDVILAGGEYVLSPDQVRKVGGGDIKRGHQRLDDWVLETRKNHIKTLRNLKPPKRS